MIKKIKNYKKKDLEDINKLLKQWSDREYQMNPAYFKKLIKKSHVLCMYDKSDMIGTVTLVEIHKLSGLKGSLEHLIMAQSYRGRGLGEKLMKFALKFAKQLEIKTLFLTCEPERIAANALYKKLGFKIKETNFYYLDLKHT